MSLHFYFWNIILTRKLFQKTDVEWKRNIYKRSAARREEGAIVTSSDNIEFLITVEPHSLEYPLEGM